MKDRSVVLSLLAEAADAEVLRAFHAEIRTSVPGIAEMMHQ
jgi:hypothetical protein